MPQVIELAELGQLLDRILIESLEERRSGDVHYRQRLGVLRLEEEE